MCCPLLPAPQIGDRTDEGVPVHAGCAQLCIVLRPSARIFKARWTTSLSGLGAQFVVSVQSRTCRQVSAAQRGQMRCSTQEKQLAKWAAIRYSYSKHIPGLHPGWRGLRYL